MLLILGTAEVISSTEDDLITQASADFKKGNTLRENNQYDDAIRMYKKALLVIEKQYGPYDPATAQCIQNIAGTYTIMGKYAEALPLDKRFYEICKRNDKEKGRELTISALNNLAADYEKLGEFDIANPYMEESLKMCKKHLGINHPLTATVISNLANHNINKGNLEAARIMIEESIKIRMKILGQNNSDTADSIATLGTIFRNNGDYKNAITYYKKSLDIKQHINNINTDDSALIMNNLGSLLEDSGERNEALQQYHKALSIYYDLFGENNESYMGTLRNIGNIYYINGDLNNAKKYAEKLLSASRKLLPAILTLGEGQRLAWCHTYLSFDLPAVTLPPEDLSNLILNWKGIVIESLLNDEIIFRKLGNNTKNDILEYKKEINKILTTSMNPDLLKISDIRGKIDSLKSVLNRNNCTYTLLNNVNYSDVKNSLMPNEALVEIIQFRKHGQYGFSLIAPDQQPKWVPLNSGKEINDAVVSYRDAIVSGDEIKLKNQIQFLSEKILKPIIATLPANTKKIYIGADGPLNFLSFATLQDDQGKFLSEKYQVAYVGSGRDLLRPTKSVDKKSFVIYANPVFASDDTAKVTPGNTNLPASLGMRAVELAEFAKVQLPQLPGTELEAATVSRIAIDAQWTKETHLGADASKKGLMAMKAPAVLHLATHGFFLGGEEVGGEGKRGMKLVSAPDPSPVGGAVNQPKPLKGISPMRQSGVALAGGQSTLQAWGRGEFPDPSNDGILTAEEVAGLDLNGTWLVTLSACETGVGQVQSGEGVFGLRRAFMMAGAQNLLMTLWPVSDEVTPKIMADFYKKALASGDAAGSLSDVQRDWLVKLRDEKGLLAAVRDAGPFAMVVMSNPNAKLLPEAAPSTVSSSESISAVSTVSPNTSEGSNVIEFSDAISKADTGDAKAQAIVAIYYGLGYKTEKDLAKAAEYASKSAAQSDPLGQYQLGVLTSSGDGVPKDPEKGKRLKVQSIEGLNTMAADPYALAALGAMALRGEGVAKDMKKAAKLYQKSADLGYAPAQILYATMLSKGVGVQKDDDEAMRYMGKASEQNFSSQ